MTDRAPARPSILQIARQAGVSPATVSRAFNRPELLQADTLAHIQAIARQEGFRPNRVGRSLRSGSTRTIGLILPTLSNPVFAECFEGAERCAREAGYSVMLTVTSYDPALESEAVRNLLDHQVEGLILTVADAARSKVLPALRDTGRPYILIYNESSRHPYVSVDNRAAAQDMVAYLHALGHRRIAIVTGPLAASDRARRRLQGARAQARRLGMAPVAHWVMPSHTDADASPLAAALAAPDAPTALFCSNDRLAASLIARLAQAGVSVPRDVSVCGFDGMDISALFTPALTSVRQPSHDIGEHALRLLLDRIHGHEAAGLTLPHHLLAGGTAAAPRRPTAGLPANGARITQTPETSPCS